MPPAVVLCSSSATRTTFLFRKFSLSRWMFSDQSQSCLSKKTKKRPGPIYSGKRWFVLLQLTSLRGCSLSAWCCGLCSPSVTPRYTSRKSLCFYWQERISAAHNVRTVNAMGMNQSRSLTLTLKVWDTGAGPEPKNGEWGCLCTSGLAGFPRTHFSPAVCFYWLFSGGAGQMGWPGRQTELTLGRSSPIGQLSVRPAC